jgi:NAD(P)-dependent dehydrogenase (short-subunit alcohol dehydrogenase family)
VRDLGPQQPPRGRRQLDVTAFESIPATTIETIIKDHGRIDVLVNNTGFSMSGFAEEMSLDDVRHQFDTTSSALSQ